MVIFDVVKHEWSVSVTSPSSSITMNRVSYFSFIYLFFYTAYKQLLILRARVI